MEAATDFHSSDPTYALTAPIRIGSVSGMTVRIGVAAVVFEFPVAFHTGDAIDFIVLVPSDSMPIPMQCTGLVTTCEPRNGNGLFEIAASIDAFRIHAGDSHVS